MNSLRWFSARCGELLLLSLILWPTTAFSGETSGEPRAPWTTSQLRGSPEPPAPYRLEVAFPELRFQKPTSIEEIPGGNRLLITEIGGRVFSFPKQADVAAATLLLDLKQLLPAELKGRNVSLFDAEFHPRFPDSPFLFLCYVHPGKNGHTRVSRFTLTVGDNPQLVPGSERVIITWPSGGHNGGCLEFGRDGYLYISTGDGSGPNPPDGLTSGQDVSDLLGAVLRIDIDRETDNQLYAVPTDNPFIGQQGARPEIWAYGLRNPWKFGTDPQSDEIFVADNGWESWEMVHRIVRGGNCGWPVMEGRAALRTEVPVGPTPIIPPVKDHPHTEANSVIGGPVYRGTVLPDLAGSFIYGDYITGTIWAIRPDRDGAYSHSTLLDTDQRIIAFTTGSAGELYVLDFDFTGQIYQLLPSTEPDLSAQFPRRLSETGLFTSVETLTPAAGVVPYQVTAERWMDGAVAQRWVAIPGAGTITLSTDLHQSSNFPEGTVLAKNLSLSPGPGGSPVRLEMQLLHFENGRWRPYSYLWDESGADAHLVSSRGTSRSIRATELTEPAAANTRTWHVNAVNECKLCHEAGARFVLGFTASQLRREAAHDSQTNQLDWLTRHGVLSAAPPALPEDPGRLVDPHDPTQPLDDRARSYLHANCSMCHHPGGNAIVSFYLRRDLPFAKLNTNKGTGIGTFGMRDAKVIAPGDPYRSILLYRMSKLGYARMPYIGSQVVDSAGVSLVEEWIRSLPRDATEPQTAPVRSGTPESQALNSLTASPVAGAGNVEEAIRKLVQTTEGSLALVAQLHRGTIREPDAQRAIAVGAASMSTDVRGLFETFLPESQRRKTLGPTFDANEILALSGNAERGKLIFFSDGARCRNCHEIDDPARSLGPTLQQINKKFPNPADLIKHVVNPSLQIDEPVAAHLAILDDGRTVSGLVVQNTDGELVFKTTDKQIIRVPRRTIEELRRLDKSLMPERILSDLTAQEAADLFAYMRGIQGE